MSPTSPDLGPFLHAITDPARRRILQALKEKGGNSLGKDTGLCACDIEERVKLSQPAKAQHLAARSRAGYMDLQ